MAIFGALANSADHPQALGKYAILPTMFEGIGPTIPKGWGNTNVALVRSPFHTDNPQTLGKYNARRVATVLAYRQSPDTGEIPESPTTEREIFPIIPKRWGNTCPALISCGWLPDNPQTLGKYTN